jgi:WD40 repeat protein
MLQPVPVTGLTMNTSPILAQLPGPLSPCFSQRKRQGVLVLLRRCSLVGLPRSGPTCLPRYSILKGFNRYRRALHTEYQRSLALVSDSVQNARAFTQGSVLPWNSQTRFSWEGTQHREQYNIRDHRKQGKKGQEYARMTNGSYKRLQYVYSQHSASVNAVAWSPNGELIASGSGEHGKDDYTVRVWQAT